MAKITPLPDATNTTTTLNGEQTVTAVDPVAASVAVSPVAVSATPLTAGEIAQAAKEIADEAAKRGETLTGAEIAQVIGKRQPPQPAPGTRYRVVDRSDPSGAEVTITSPDGTVEDVVRMYNNGKKDIRTAKQLLITPVASV